MAPCRYGEPWWLEPCSVLSASVSSPLCRASRCRGMVSGTSGGGGMLCSNVRSGGVVLVERFDFDPRRRRPPFLRAVMVDRPAALAGRRLRRFVRTAGSSASDATVGSGCEPPDMDAALARRRAAFARMILSADPDDALGRRTGGTRPIGADTGRIRIPGAACKAAGAEACEHKRWVVTHGLECAYMCTVVPPHCLDWRHLAPGVAPL